MKQIETVLSETTYILTKKGYSRFSGDPVTIIGERKVLYESKVLDQYVYNIDTYKALNGKPFVALKSNIYLILE